MPAEPTSSLACPLCGGANACAPASSGSFDGPCWCEAVTFDADLLAGVPASQRGVACVCAACATSAALRATWRRAWRGIGARSDGDALFEALMAAWREPHRHYHTLQHLRECLDLLARVEALTRHAAEIAVGLWFHDAIYDVRRSDNEARSAEWLREAAGGDGVAGDVVERIAASIMATRHAAMPSEADEQLLVDIDLQILAAPEARFAAYERQIRAEYAFVPEATFAARRRAVLTAFLERDRIYSTPRLHDELEQAARANLLRSIAGRG